MAGCVCVCVVDEARKEKKRKEKSTENRGWGHDEARHVTSSRVASRRGLPRVPENAAHGPLAGYVNNRCVKDRYR